MSPRQHELLSLLSSLPQKILAHQGSDHIVELVLHDLCSRSGFNLPQAAYFVDNPDFDCLKGVVGLHTAEVCPLENPWKDPRILTNALATSPFNQRVRATTEPSTFKKGKNRDTVIRELAERIGIPDPAYCSWGMKHDNHGVLIFQKMANQTPDIDECLEKGASILGFCPIY